MALYYTTLRGTCGQGSGVDEFSHSLGIVSNGSEIQVTDAVHTSWIEFWQGGGGGIDASYEASTVYVETTAARVIDQTVPDLGAANHRPFTPGLPGLSTAPPLPQQTSVVVSLLAGQRPNGTPFRGRFYMPAPSTITLSVEGTMDTTFQSALAVRIREHFQRLIAAGHVPSLWSRTVAGLVNPINEVRVGNKFDTMRSRRNDIPEVYVSQPIG